MDNQFENGQGNKSGDLHFLTTRGGKSQSLAMSRSIKYEDENVSHQITVI